MTVTEAIPYVNNSEKNSYEDGSAHASDIVFYGTRSTSVMRSISVYGAFRYIRTAIDAQELGSH